MKKIFSILTLAILLTAVPASAQPGEDFFNLGVKAGMNFTNMSQPEDAFQSGFLKTYTGFSAGLVFNFNLPLGFEINPELQYVQSGYLLDSSLESVNSRYTSGSVRVPINLQWGFRFLGVVKPYVVVSPYVGAVLFGKNTTRVGDSKVETMLNEDISHFQYGVGVGAGLYVWRFQLAFKWNWDLNPILSNRERQTAIGGSELIPKHKSKFNGGELSLAFFF